MKASHVKRVVAAGGVAAALTLGALGIASAQQASTTPTPSGQPQVYQQYVSDLAQRLNVTPQQLQQAMQGARQDVGWNGPVPGQGPQGRGGPGGGAAMRGVMQQMLATAAQALGISPQQFMQELPGNTLTQVAQNHNVDPTTVQTALVNEANQMLDQALANGKITQAQHDQIAGNVQQRVQSLMSRQFPQHPAGPGPNGGPGGPNGEPGGPNGRPGGPNGWPGRPGPGGPPQPSPSGS